METYLLRKLRKRFSAKFHIRRVNENRWKVFEYRESSLTWENEFEYDYGFAKTLPAAKKIKKDLVRICILGYIEEHRDPYKIKSRCDKYLW